MMDNDDTFGLPCVGMMMMNDKLGFFLHYYEGANDTFCFTMHSHVGKKWHIWLYLH